MRVGVYLDDYLPEDGGGYTFQGEIFGALRKLASQSSHEYVILGADRDVKHQLEGTPLQWVYCPIDNLWDRFIASLVRAWPSLRSRWRWTAPMERRARTAGIQFIWFLGPRHPDVDLPYMTVVLDLQHRLQPWFPEVSIYGEWQNRERHYASRLRRAAAIIAGTNAGKKEIQTFYQIPDERIHILPHPTPNSALDSETVKDDEVLRRMNLDPGYLFYPAQFWAHKNHVNLLRALKSLKDQGKRYQLVLAGSDFGNRAYVEACTKDLGLSDQVRFMGFVKQAEMNVLYRNAYALTYVSFFGPENLPPLEAFALGCPVIASRVSGAEEQLGGAALMVDPTDPEEIANAVVQLSDISMREKQISRGKLRASQWSSEDFVRGVFKILDSFTPIRRTWKN